MHSQKWHFEVVWKGLNSIHVGPIASFFCMKKNKSHTFFYKFIQNVSLSFLTSYIYSRFTPFVDTIWISIAWLEVLYNKHDKGFLKKC